MNHEVTTDAEVLTGVSINTAYTIQNNTGRVVYLVTATSKPANIRNAIRLQPRGFEAVGTFEVKSGESVYVWSSRAGGSVVYVEAV